MRTCSDCNICIDHLYHNRTRCKNCAVVRRRKLLNVHERKFRALNPGKIQTAQRKYRAENREYVLGVRRKWAANYIRTPRAKFQALQAKCRKFGYDLDLTQEDCEAIWAQPCVYCGGSTETQSGAGLDRIDNKLGYLKNNVLSCCGTCNMIRGPRLTVDEMKVAMAAVLKLRGEIKCSN